MQYGLQQTKTQIQKSIIENFHPLLSDKKINSFLSCPTSFLPCFLPTFPIAKTSPKIAADWQTWHSHSAWAEFCWGPQAPRQRHSESVILLLLPWPAEHQVFHLCVQQKQMLRKLIGASFCSVQKVTAFCCCCSLWVKYLRNCSTASIIIQTSQPGTQEAEAGGSWFEARLGNEHTEANLKTTEEKKKRNCVVDDHERLRNKKRHF